MLIKIVQTFHTQLKDDRSCTYMGSINKYRKSALLFALTNTDNIPAKSVFPVMV